MRISFQQVRVRPPRPGQPSGTDEIWDKTGTAAGPGFELARLKRGEITFVFKKDGQEVFVYNASVYRNYDWGPQTYYDMESNFDAQVYIDGTGWVGREYYDYTYWDDDSYLVNIYLENAEQYQENLMRLDFSEMAGTGSKPNVTVYQGAYQDRETLQAAIASGEAKEVTSEVWGSEAPGIKGNFCYTNQNQAPRFTLLIQQGNIPDSDWGGDDGQDIVLSISARIVNPEFSLMGPIDVCYGEDRKVETT